MAYQKLQAGRALAVIPSDTVDIPNIAAVTTTGTSDAEATLKLIDAAGDFLNKRVAIGDIIYAGTVAATVTAIDSATVLSTSATIPTLTAYTIYSQANNPQNGCVLYCGGEGTISVVTAGGDTVELVGVPAGLFIPVQVLRVNASVVTGTIATNIVALW
jgi:hypothetical protein